MNIQSSQKFSCSTTICTFKKKMQNITFHSNESLEKILKNPRNNKTTLTEWMETNKSNDEAKKLSYIEFTNRWVWNNKTKIWTPRKKGNTIHQTFYVHLNSGELYYLGLLLNHKKGATSF